MRDGICIICGDLADPTRSTCTQCAEWARNPPPDMLDIRWLTRDIHIGQPCRRVPSAQIFRVKRLLLAHKSPSGAPRPHVILEQVDTETGVGIPGTEVEINCTSVRRAPCKGTTRREFTFVPREEAFELRRKWGDLR